MGKFTGLQIKKYKIGELLGHGGMASVYKAIDQNTGNHVAIKFIAIAGPNDEKTAYNIARFEREAKAMSTLKHPAIAPIYEYGEWEETPYFVTKYFPGGTLSERIGIPMEPQKAAELLLPIARGLAHAHENHIIHRDVKPSNILFNENGYPVLCDFGVARFTDLEEGQTLTATNALVGTPAYMPPEQSTGQAVDGRIDIYALGVIFYELLTGKRPYVGANPISIILKQLKAPLPDPKVYNTNLPDYITDVLLVALAKQPKNRFSEMELFAEVLEAIASDNLSALRDNKIIHDYLENAQINALQELVDAETIDSVEIANLLNQQKKKSPSTILVIAISILSILFLAVIALLLIGYLQKDQSGQDDFQLGLIKPSLTMTSTRTVTYTPTISNTVTLTQTSTSTPTLTLTLTRTVTPTTTETFTPSPSPTSIQPKVRSQDGMTMIYIPKGIFKMGSDDELIEWMMVQSWCNDCELEEFETEGPQHWVTTNAYWIDQTEVTNRQYRQCVAAGACTQPEQTRSYTRSNYYFGTYGNYPVIYVTWYQANDYCKWVGGRLPTEAEWERAARGDDDTRIFAWGNEPPTTKLTNFYLTTFNDTDQVGMYPQGVSPWGVLDMVGNVWEWTNDIYNDHYPSREPQFNPENKEGSTGRVIRGGSFANVSKDVRINLRYEYPPDRAMHYIGFRCVIPGE